MNDVLYQIGYLQRLPLGTNYVAIVAYIGRLLGQFPGAELVIDLTGVGRPVGDLFAYGGITPTGVMITAGMSSSFEGTTCYVPKLVLVSRLTALLHAGRLRILKTLPEAATLTAELADFRVGFTPTGGMTFNARVGRHDDLVLALALAVWRADGGGLPHYGIWEGTRLLAGGLPREWYIGLDLGQSRDPTAVCIVRKVERPTSADLEHMPVFGPKQISVQPGSREYAAAHNGDYGTDTFVDIH